MVQRRRGIAGGLFCDPAPGAFPTLGGRSIPSHSIKRCSAQRRRYDVIVARRCKQRNAGQWPPGAVLVEGRSPIVARLHCEVGDRALVILPDGRLESIPDRSATPTDRPFAAPSKEELQNN